MNSMTGFGRAELRDSNYQVVVEIKTINSKKSDIVFKMPAVLNIIESTLREAVKDKLVRGRIEIRVDFSDLTEGGSAISLNRELAEKYIAMAKELAGLDEAVDAQITLDTLLSVPDLIQVSDPLYEESTLQRIVVPVFTKALDEVCDSRAREGTNLRDDILEHAGSIEEIIRKIETLAPGAFETAKENLRKKVLEALEDVEFDETRFLNEVAILADKLAIDEEITRLKSHVALLIDTCDREEPVGRKLDFTLQELNREANTIASKSEDIQIINASVDLKSEIEKIREQVQNVE